MVDAHGRAKVLDFGLAKQSAPAAVDAVGAEETTRSLAVEQVVSEEGVILGTVPYLSPEQVEGKPLDACSDIFSFGAVLYEMITGQHAFRGKSKISTLAVGRGEGPAAGQRNLFHHAAGSGAADRALPAQGRESAQPEHGRCEAGTGGTAGRVGIGEAGSAHRNRWCRSAPLAVAGGGDRLRADRRGRLHLDLPRPSLSSVEKPGADSFIARRRAQLPPAGYFARWRIGRLCLEPLRHGRVVAATGRRPRPDPVDQFQRTSGQPNVLPGWQANPLRHHLRGQPEERHRSDLPPWGGGGASSASSRLGISATISPWWRTRSLPSPVTVPISAASSSS